MPRRQQDRLVARWRRPVVQEEVYGRKGQLLNRRLQDGLDYLLRKGSSIRLQNRENNSDTSINLKIFVVLRQGNPD